MCQDCQDEPLLEIAVEPSDELMDKAARVVSILNQMPMPPSEKTTVDDFVYEVVMRSVDEGLNNILDVDIDALTAIVDSERYNVAIKELREIGVSE